LIERDDARRAQATRVHLKPLALRGVDHLKQVTSGVAPSSEIPAG